MNMFAFGMRRCCKPAGRFGLAGAPFRIFARAAGLAVFPRLCRVSPRRFLRPNFRGAGRVCFRGALPPVKGAGAHAARSRPRFRARAASAVLFVLCLVFAASVLMVTLAEYAASELRSRASSQYESDLRTDAYSVLNATIAVLEEYRSIDGNLYSEKQGWGSPLGDGRIKFDTFEAEVRVTDETGKIPLANLDTAELVAIFEEMNISSVDAQTLADCLLDWTDSDSLKRLNGAETDDYDDYAPKPPNRALVSLLELRHIERFDELFFDSDGNPNELYLQFAEIVSVENFDKVNLNSAGEEVLKMLMALKGRDYDPNIYRALSGEIGFIEDGIIWTKDDGVAYSRGAPELPDDNWKTYTANLLKIEIVVRRGIAEYYLCVYYGAEGTGSVSGGAKKADSTRLTNTSSSSSSSGSQSAKRSVGSQGSTGKAQSQSSATQKISSGGAKIVKVRERGR